MWHEARKQERLIRGMIVDYRRRAERRKDFYEKIKAEPTQFLQLHGRQCKIHLDPAVAAAGEGPAIMMPWQGDTSNMIDRFDVRAHLDFIPDVKTPDIPPEDLSQEERQCNYERYRILAQNGFLGISEDKFLQQLAIEEQFGVTVEEKEMQKEKLSEKKGTGAAIGYNYNDPGAQPSSYNGPEVKKKEVEAKDSDDDSDLDIIDVDLSIDVNKMEASQAHELNAVGPQFGMAGCDLFSFLTGDADDAEHQKQLLREEKEKAMFSGRKSRRERRAHRDKKLATRVMSPPSYAAPSAAARASRSPTRSPSRSPSPEHSAIQFITSFGPEEEEKPPPPPKPLYADKLKQNLKKPDMLYSEVVRKPRPRSKSIDLVRPKIGPRGPNSASRSRSRSRSLSRSRSKSRSRSRSRSKSRSYSRSRSRSRSRSSRSRSKSFVPYRRTRSRSRSRSRSRNYRRRSRSLSNNASGYANRNRSRSISYERQREMRHQRYRNSSDDDSDSRSGSSSRQSPFSERKRDARSRSKSTPPPEKRIPVWEADKDPSPPASSYKPKPPEVGETSFLSRKRLPESSEGYPRDTRSDGNRELTYQNRYDKYPNREPSRYIDSSFRQDGYERTSRFDQDRYQDPNMRRQFSQRGGYRAQNVRNPEQSYGDSSMNRYRDTDHSYGDGPSSRYRELKDYGDGPSGRYRDSEQNYGDGPSKRYRDSEQNYGDGPSRRYRDSEQSYGDGPSGRYRDSDYGDGPSARYRDSGPHYGDATSSRYRHDQDRESNNYRNKVKLVDY